MTDASRRILLGVWPWPGSHPASIVLLTRNDYLSLECGDGTIYFAPEAFSFARILSALNLACFNSFTTCLMGATQTNKLSHQTSAYMTIVMSFTAQDREHLIVNHPVF